MLITTKTHLARMADKDAEIAGLMARLSAGQRVQEADARRINEMRTQRSALLAEAAEWKAKAGAFRDRLIPFERVRGKGGRFVKSVP